MTKEELANYLAVCASLAEEDDAGGLAYVKPEALRQVVALLCPEERPLPGGIPLAEFIADLERDPEMKSRFDAERAKRARATAEPSTPQWDVNSIERIARQQGVFGGREGNTVTITGPIVISGPSSRTT